MSEQSAPAVQGAEQPLPRHIEVNLEKIAAVQSVEQPSGARELTVRERDAARKWCNENGYPGPTDSLCDMLATFAAHSSAGERERLENLFNCEHKAHLEVLEINTRLRTKRAEAEAERDDLKRHGESLERQIQTFAEQNYRLIQQREKAEQELARATLHTQQHADREERQAQAIDSLREELVTTKQQLATLREKVKEQAIYEDSITGHDVTTCRMCRQNLQKSIYGPSRDGKHKEGCVVAECDPG